MNHHATNHRATALAAATALLATLAVLCAPALAQAQEADSPVERDLRRYWSGEREMPVIGGDKLFVTEGRFELMLFGGILPNDSFYNYYPVGGGVGYSFDGTWGLELTGAYVGLTSDSELTDFLEAEGDSIDPAVDLGDKQIARVDLVATFSPLYGKWSFQTYKISHFDLFFALGAGMVIVEEPELVSGSDDPLPDPVTQVLPEGLIGAGFRFFALDWLDLRVDARWYLYPRFDGSGDDPDARTVGAPAQITLGVGFLLPAL